MLANNKKAYHDYFVLEELEAGIELIGPEVKSLRQNNEILKLMQQKSEKGCTIVPLELYFSNGRVKVKIALCKGKKLYDKRNTIKEHDIKRDAERDFNRR